MALGWSYRLQRWDLRATTITVWEVVQRGYESVWLLPVFAWVLVSMLSGGGKAGGRSMSGRDYGTKMVVRTERGAVWSMLFWTALTAVFMFMQVPHSLKGAASGVLALAGAVAIVMRVLAVLREAERVEMEDGDVREPGAVERMLFEVALIVPVVYSGSLLAVLRAFDE